MIYEELFETQPVVFINTKKYPELLDMKKVSNECEVILEDGETIQDFLINYLKDDSINQSKDILNFIEYLNDGGAINTFIIEIIKNK